MLDVAYCHRCHIVAWLYMCVYLCWPQPETYKNGRTEQDAVGGMDLDGPKENALDGACIPNEKGAFKGHNGHSIIQNYLPRAAHDEAAICYHYCSKLL